MIGKEPNEYTIKERMIQACILFPIGGLVYVLLELCTRGYSHISMFFLGGICFVLIGLLNEPMRVRNIKLRYQMLIGGFLIVTPLEFLTGYILNVKLGLMIWDYSNVPLNIMGQICLPFSLLWCLVSLVAIFVDDTIRHILFHQEYPDYKF